MAIAIYGVTVRVALLTIDPLEAEIVTTVLVNVAFVSAVNFADLDPAATVTLLGTVTSAVLLLDRLTNIPPVGAGPLSTTVPVDELPPLTVLGAKVNEDKTGGFTVSVADTVFPE